MLLAVPSTGPLLLISWLVTVCWLEFFGRWLTQLDAPQRRANIKRGGKK
jgi:hypothetical protein